MLAAPPFYTSLYSHAPSRSLPVPLLHAFAHLMTFPTQQQPLTCLPACLTLAGTCNYLLASPVTWLWKAGRKLSCLMNVGLTLATGTAFAKRCGHTLPPHCWNSHFNCYGKSRTICIEIKCNLKKVCISLGRYIICLGDTVNPCGVVFVAPKPRVAIVTWKYISFLEILVVDHQYV